MKKAIEHSKFVNRFIHETGLSISEVTRLFEIEKKLSEYNERECSDPMTDGMVKVMNNNREKLIKEIRIMVNSTIQIQDFDINHDPRGPAIRMKMTSGWYNCPDETLALSLE